MRKLIALIVISAMLLPLVLFVARESKPLNQIAEDTQENVVNDVPISASFAIFTNGTFREFSNARYHNQSEDVYIESSNVNKIVVTKLGITWGDFFETLPMKLTHQCLTTGTNQVFCDGNGGSLKFYINGERVENALDMQINDSDSLLVSFGNESEDVINMQLQ